MAAEVIKDRDLLARVAAYSPHIAGTMLRLLNDLEDAHRLGELPPPELLRELGQYMDRLGRFLGQLSLADHEAPLTVSTDDV